jgi:hypothetical protein
MRVNTNAPTQLESSETIKTSANICIRLMVKLNAQIKVVNNGGWLGPMSTKHVNLTTLAYLLKNCSCKNYCCMFTTCSLGRVMVTIMGMIQL